MSVEDELHWARGHVERLIRQSNEVERREHVEGALHHALLAVEGLAASPLVEGLAAVRLKPGEVLFARVPVGTAPEVCSALHADLAKMFPDHEVRVDNVGVEFEAVSVDG